MFILEVIFSGGITRAQFATKRRADNARRKLEKELSKGKFRNSDDVVTIKADSSTVSVRPSEVNCVVVMDHAQWVRGIAEANSQAKAAGLVVND